MLQQYKAQLNAKRVVLASASPRRKEALTLMGLQFEVVPSTFAEDLDKATVKSSAEYVELTARHKAIDVWNKLAAQSRAPDLIIACDTVVVRDDIIIEKPSSREHAIEILTSLSGRGHHVFSGMALLVKSANPSNPVTPYEILGFSERTDVEFTFLTREVIEAYVETGIPMDKAGAYGIQDGLASTFVSGIHGCYFNVVGFPIHRFCVKVVELFDAKKL